MGKTIFQCTCFDIFLNLNIEDKKLKDKIRKKFYKLEQERRNKIIEKIEKACFKLNYINKQ